LGFPDLEIADTAALPGSFSGIFSAETLRLIQHDVVKQQAVTTG
jgi:hypothetical protein